MKTVKDRAYSFSHTRERLLQRCQVSMSLEEYNHLCQKFIDKKVTIDNVEGEQVIFLTGFKGSMIKFVWSSKRKLITTALKTV